MSRCSPKLRGEDASEAARGWDQIQLDYPELELEAGALTLREIQDRAEAFDPLTLELNLDARAISANAWFSLGRHGVGLNFARAPSSFSAVTVLARGTRGKRWDHQVMDRFSTLEEAVQAVDYEIDRRGRAASASARDDAPWRYETTARCTRRYTCRGLAPRGVDGRHAALTAELGQRTGHGLLSNGGCSSAFSS